MYRNVGIYEKTYLFLVNDINYGNQLASIWTKRNVDDSSNLHEPCVCLQHNHIFPYVQAQPLLSAKIKITRDPEKFITETRSSAIAETMQRRKHSAGRIEAQVAWRDHWCQPAIRLSHEKRCTGLQLSHSTERMQPRRTAVNIIGFGRTVAFGTANKTLMSTFIRNDE